MFVTTCFVRLGLNHDHVPSILIHCTPSELHGCCGLDQMLSQLPVALLLLSAAAVS
jgi:hypothetical protein